MTWATVAVSVGTTVAGGYVANQDKKRGDKRAAYNETFERDRDQQIKAARGQIDQVFDSPARQQQRANFGGSLQSYLDTALNRQHQDAGRNLKFALAKQGLTGGSVDIDKGRRLGEEFADAAIGNQRTVAGEVAQLQGQDEQQRNALKAMASTGMGLTEANRRALTAGQQNLATADYGRNVRGIGDVFADTAATYKGINERAALAAGYNAKRANLYGRA